MNQYLSSWYDGENVTKIKESVIWINPERPLHHLPKQFQGIPKKSFFVPLHHPLCICVINQAESSRKFGFDSV
jgi:hypothetical protein